MLPPTQEVQVRKRRRLGPAPVVIEPPKSVKEMLQSLSARNASKERIQPTQNVQESAGYSQRLSQQNQQKLSGIPMFRRPDSLIFKEGKQTELKVGSKLEKRKGPGSGRKA